MLMNKQKWAINCMWKEKQQSVLMKNDGFFDWRGHTESEKGRLNA